eukprot:CFRG3435T1
MLRRIASALRSIDQGNNGGKSFVGKDAHGNRFYELAPQRQGGRLRRIYEPPNGGVDPQLAIHNNIVAEWRSWLSGTRQLPPSEEEMSNEIRRMHVLEHNVKELEAIEREEIIRKIGETAMADRDQRAAKLKHLQMVDHASAWDNSRKSFRNENRKGDDFQPQGWDPQSIAAPTEEQNENNCSSLKLSKQRKSHTSHRDSEDSFTPGEWTP